MTSHTDVVPLLYVCDREREKESERKGARDRKADDINAPTKKPQLLAPTTMPSLSFAFNICSRRIPTLLASSLSLSLSLSRYSRVLFGCTLFVCLHRWFVLRALWRNANANTFLPLFFFHFPSHDASILVRVPLHFTNWQLR